MSFKNLGLNPTLLSTLSDLGYRESTPIQTQAIPAILNGEDVLGIAQTGTGKTAAFCLPILNVLLQQKVKANTKRPKVLVLSPTRELAAQIRAEVAKFVKGTSLRYGVITGGVSQRPQERTLNKGVEILVATPGRLLDLASNRLVDLREVSHLVLDEADQLLDMGFVRDITKIVKMLPKKRQTLLFSATMPKEVESLAADILHNPTRMQVSPKVITVEQIAQGFIDVETSGKQELLQRLLSLQDLSKAIVFTRTKHGADKVAKKLNKGGVAAEVIHGNKSQNARNRALDKFKSGEAWVLVATDVAARGIDIPEISHVINFDVPNEPEVYVHRIGRTARAGASGVAWSLVDASENKRVWAIERLTKLKSVWFSLDEENEIVDLGERETKNNKSKKGRNHGNRQKVNNESGGSSSSNKKRRRRNRRRPAAKAA